MDDGALELHLIRKVSWRLLPFLFVLYIFSYLDRSNISIAALQMNSELKFSASIFGLGAGVFFVGYSLFELPSNLILARVGARIWIARIMITWGVLAVAMMFVKTPAQFYTVRFLLGVAEAGFFPGVIYYLSKWFPRAYQARATARFTIAIPLAQVLGGLLGGPLLSLQGSAGISGWQWLFLLEGLPSIIFGIVVLFYLSDDPQTAAWLSKTEREWLATRLQRDQPPTDELEKRGQLIGGLRDPVIWLLTIPYFAYYAMGFGYIAWAPTLIKGVLGTQNTMTTLVSAAIALLSVAAYILSGFYSDRTRDRCALALAGLVVASVGCVGLSITPSATLQLAMLTLIPIGSGIFLPTFWCLPSLRFDGVSSAGPIALISAIGSTGGFFGPSIIGYGKEVTGNDTGAFAALALIGLAGCCVCWALSRSTSFKRARPATTSVTTAA